MVTKTEAIKNFLLVKTSRDLADSYGLNMEVQVNVARDSGERVDKEFKGRQWNAWTNGVQTWYPFRIPKNASSEPEYTDSEIKYDLAEHAEGIGMTGWDWVARASMWVAFDFDGLVGHSVRHERKLTEAELREVERAVSEIPWVTLRRSTSGKGLHVYVYLEPVATKNHTEHAALARAILGLMSAVAGFDFGGKVDICGGNMWVWHRKMERTDGLVLLRAGGKLRDIPANWRDHVKVVSGRRRKNLPFFIEESEQLFMELTSRRMAVPLDDGHKRLIGWLQANNCQWWWDNDHHMLVCHTHNLRQAHGELGFRGIFKTVAEGTEPGADHNAFAFPLRNGAWGVRRYTRGVAEDATWDQDGNGWTRCYYNRDPDLPSASRSSGGVELTSGGFVFRHAELAAKAAEAVGTSVKLPAWALGREAVLKQHKDGRLIMTVEKDSRDRGEEMEGWQPEKDKWIRIFNTRIQAVQETETGNFDDLIRHLVTESGGDYGWVLRSDTDWRIEPLEHIKIAIKSMGHKPREVDSILGSSVFRCWTMVNKPFQPEYGLDRRWNREAAQIRFFPNENRDALHYPTWMSILEHCGKDLDGPVGQHEWCRANSILTGADYLKVWIASLFKDPLEPLPYLFFYGPQSSGKSVFHEALSLLITHGCVRADNALISQSGFNGELEQAVLCVVEETDLRKNKTAYNRIKDWVTSPFLPIHRKQRTPYTVRNCTHWIQCQPDSTWIMTSEGPRRIKELIDQSVNIVVDGQKHQTKGFFHSGMKEVYEISTSRGYTVRATEEHPFLVDFDGLQLWIKTIDLKVGQKLVLNNHHNFNWDGEGNHDDGYILGFLFGDGSFRSREGDIDPVIYIYNDTEIVARLSSILDQCNVLSRKDGAFTLAGKQLKRICQNYGVSNREISPDLESLSSEFYSGFLSGLFDTDGSVSVDRKAVVLYQSDEFFLRAIQRMLLRLGITSTIGKARSSGTAASPKGTTINAKASYSLSVINKGNLIRFLERVNFCIGRKQNLLNKTISSWSRNSVEVSYEAEVISVTPVRIESVYDITVPGINCYDSNGFKAHNCANDYLYCPVFTGDTRITMAHVGELERPVPKKQLFPILEKEAPDFLAEILNLELPATSDRLNIPIIVTEEKLRAERGNQTSLEMFLSERCHYVTGRIIKFSEFYEAFKEWLDPSEVQYWSKSKVGRELPKPYIRGRLQQTGQHYMANMSWSTRKSEEAELPSITIRGDYLAGVNYDLYRSYCLGRST